MDLLLKLENNKKLRYIEWKDILRNYLSKYLIVDINKTLSYPT